MVERCFQKGGGEGGFDRREDVITIEMVSGV